MRIGNSRDLGRYIRDRRHQRRQSQADLARAAGVSRRWLSDLEAGKPTAEAGLVFQTFAALEVVLDARPLEESAHRIDLDAHLRSIGQP